MPVQAALAVPVQTAPVVAVQEAPVTRSAPVYENIFDAEPDIVIDVSSDSEWDTVEPDDPQDRQSTTIDPVGPVATAAPASVPIRACAARRGKPLAEMKRQLQTVDEEELLSVSVSSSVSSRRVAQELATTHLKYTYQCSASSLSSLCVLFLINVC